MTQYNLHDTSLFSYRLVSVDKQGHSIDLTPLAKHISWGGSLQGAAMSLKVDLAPYPGLGDLVTYGDQLFLYGTKIEDGSTFEIMRGYIFDRGRKSGNEGMHVEAYDLLIYLLKNKEDYVFRASKASSIFTSILTDFGIPIGKVDDTGHAIDKVIARNTPLYDLMVKALVLTREATGAKFFIRAKEGRVSLVRKPVNPETWVLAGGVNLLNASVDESIQDMKNKIVVRANEQNGERSTVLAIAADSNLIKSFGVLQDIQDHSIDGSSKGKAIDVAKYNLQKLGKVTRRASVSALALNTLLPGDPVIVEEPTTGLQGTYYVQDITFNVNGATATMDVTLRWDDDLQADTSINADMNGA